MIETINSIAGSWWSWMSSMFWQVAVLVVVVFLIDLLLGKKLYPQMRYALWLLVLLKLVIPPDFALPTGLFSSLDPIITPHIERATAPAAQSSKEVSAFESTRVEQENTAGKSMINPVTVEAGLNFTAYLFLLWLAGVLAFVSLLVARIMQMVKWQKEEEIPKWLNNSLRAGAKLLGLNYLPSIVFAEDIPTPAVYGLFRPVLVLPKEYSEALSKKELFYMTLHELSHLKRNDLWTHAFAVLLQCLYWFNPFLYLVQRKLKQTREVCCDLTVSRALKGESKPYRKTLINAARRWLTRKPSPALGLLGVFEEPHQIINRINWLERKMIDIKPLTMISVLAMLGFFLVFIMPMSGNSSMIDLEGLGSQDGIYAAELSQGKYLHMITENRLDKYAMGVKTGSSKQGSEEVWMDNNRVAIIQDKVKVIADLKKNEFIYMNRMAQDYVITKMPVNEKELYNDELKKFFEGRRYEVELKNTGRKKKILGRECQVWTMKRTVMNSQGQRWGGKLELWIDPDVKINYAPFETAMDNIRRISGGDAEAVGKMKLMKGFQHRIDFNAEAGLFDSKLISELKVFEFAVPPEGTFEIPHGYTKKEKISRADLY
jgi:beta-lactamase regulating signal transducer with metallopeptidase domain